MEPCSPTYCVCLNKKYYIGDETSHQGSAHLQEQHFSRLVCHQLDEHSSYTISLDCTATEHMCEIVATLDVIM